MLFVKNISCTCHIDALPEVEVCEARAVEERHGEAGVLHGGALGHVQVGEGGRGRGSAGPRHRHRRDHGAAWQQYEL